MEMINKLKQKLKVFLKYIKFNMVNFVSKIKDQKIEIEDDSFSEISKEDKEFLDKIFHKYDPTGSGIISKSDYKNFLMDFFITPSKSNLILY